MAKKKNIIKKVFLVLSIIIVTIFASLIIVCTYFYNKYDLDVQKLTSLNNGIKVYSASGTDSTLYNTNRSIVEIETLPKHVIDAFVDVEDKRFYTHNGYDLKRIAKAFFVNMSTNSKTQGASTISQQLIKNALLSNEKTYSRKIKELVLSIKMEKQFSKDEILEMYLNTIYFGSNAYGIENASKTYFNKSANELTVNETCCLAGLIKSPNKYSPKLNYNNSIQRKNIVANLMLQQGDITTQQYNEVLNSELSISTSNNNNQSYEQQAILEACSLLNISERELINKQYSIITYKDDTLQNETSIINKKILNSTKEVNSLQLDSSSIVLDNNGHVLVYYTNSNYDINNIKRQPASLIKPLAVYLPCLTHNILSPANTILDEPINYSGYIPKNADGKFHGYVSVREALAQSYNIPAVKSLDYVGLNKAKYTLEKLGINISNSDLNLSLALGGMKNGISLLDLTNAYSIIANMGINKGYTFINKILDRNGKVIYSSQDFQEQVVNSDDCFLLTDMLKDTVKYGTAKRLNELNLNIASKTGTAGNANGNTDLYNVTYSTEHTILTWIANIKDNFLPNSMHSSVEPTQINKEILQKLYKNHTPKDFYIPETIQKMPYDTAELEKTNKLVTPNHNIQRYIAYDYFKITNKPSILNENELFLSVTLQKNGAKLYFEPKKNKEYKVIRKINNVEEIFAEIIDTDNDIELLDNNIFNYESVSYYIKDFNNQIISDIVEVRPKDFLVNLLNNEILNGKKKWLV